MLSLEKFSQGVRIDLPRPSINVIASLLGSCVDEEKKQKVLQVLGRHVGHIMTFKAAVEAGQDWEITMQNMIRQAAWRLEKISLAYLQSISANSNIEEQCASLRAYERFWRFIELLVQKRSVAFDEVIDELFAFDMDELEKFEHTGLITVSQSLGQHAKTYIQFFAPHFSMAAKHLLNREEIVARRANIEQLLQQQDRLEMEKIAVDDIKSALSLLRSLRRTEAAETRVKTGFESVLQRCDSSLLNQLTEADERLTETQVDYVETAGGSDNSALVADMELIPAKQTNGVWTLKNLQQTIPQNDAHGK